MAADVVIRTAVEADLPDISTIYNHEVVNSHATFDLEPPTLTYWEQRLAGGQQGDHLLVMGSLGLALAARRFDRLLLH